MNVESLEITFYSPFKYENYHAGKVLNKLNKRRIQFKLLF